VPQDCITPSQESIHNLRTIIGYTCRGCYMERLRSARDSSGAPLPLLFTNSWGAQSRQPQWISINRQIAVRAVLALLAIMCVSVFGAAQDPNLLAARSSVAIRGKIERVNASEEPLLSPSRQTAVVTVQQMYSGNEVAGDQTGKTVTVILSRPELVKRGE